MEVPFSDHAGVLKDEKEFSRRKKWEGWRKKRTEISIQDDKADGVQTCEGLDRDGRTWCGLQRHWADTGKVMNRCTRCKHLGHILWGSSFQSTGGPKSVSGGPAKVGRE